MLDIKWIRDNQEHFLALMNTRGVDARETLAEMMRYDAIRRADLTNSQGNESEANALSKVIGQKKAKGEDATAEMDQVKALNDGIDMAKARIRISEGIIDECLMSLPNLPDNAVPVGDESANAVVEVWGEPGNIYTPVPGVVAKCLANAKPHWDIPGFDFETAAKMSGSRFTILRGEIAKLERALTNFLVDIQTKERGHELVSVPLLVRENALYGTGQLPKFKDDLFQTTDGRYLIPTAEVSLTNIVADSIVDASALPMRLCAVTPCFRSEAGAAGRDERGMIRQHQFNKLELVSIAHPDNSAAELERMVESARLPLIKLGLPHRVVLLSTRDMGFGAAMTYDIEVWLPGQNAYREISSCSNCKDFQARRLKTRFKENKKNHLVHTLNGSGLAIGRLLIAVVENYQRENGSIGIPKFLQEYM